MKYTTISLILLALDSSTKIYTLATGGNDHIIKIWRIFCATDIKSSRKNSTVDK